jgi:nitrogen regulatory protein PII
MKKIEAVILPSRVNTVRAELRRRGICAELTLTEVRHAESHTPSISADDSAEQLPERVKLELIVGERQAEKAITIILRHALTDSPGPGGHVTLLDVSEVLQIAHPTSGAGNFIRK